MLSPFSAKSFHPTSLIEPLFLTSLIFSSEKSTTSPLLTSIVLTFGSMIDISFTSEFILKSFADLLVASFVAAEIPLALTVAPVTLSNIFLPS